jgi:DNA-binding MarR family transcriptional regulator
MRTDYPPAPRRDPTGSTPDAEAILAGHYAWNRRGFLLWHATLRWQRAVAQALRPLKLTHVQFVLLGSIWYLQREGTTPSQRELAEHAGTDPMMTSQVVRVLEQRALVERVRDSADGRVVRLRTTRAGERLAKRAVVTMDHVDRAFFDPAGPTDEILPVLRRLAHRDERGATT